MFDKFLRISRIKFDFTLGAFYHTSVIESNNAVEAEFGMEVTLSNELHSGHIHAEVHLSPKLSRFCGDNIKANVILDIVVLILLVLSAGTDIISIFTSLKLANVCSHTTYYVASISITGVFNFAGYKIAFLGVP